MNKLLSICSYNSQGSGTGRFEYLNELMTKVDVVLVQEHWLAENQFSLFRKNLHNVNVHSVTPMSLSKNNCGRPYGGCAIIWNSSLVASVTPVANQTKRVCAVKIEFGNHDILLCNVYMPTYQSAQGTYLQELNDVFTDVESLIKEFGEQYIIIGGDFNTSFSKTGYNTDALVSFMRRQHLQCALSHHTSEIQFTFESKANGSRSVIDHFLLSEVLMKNILHYKSLHDYCNFSDQCPIVMKLNIPVEYLSINSEASEEHIMWQKASFSHINNYKSMLDSLLSKINIPLCIAQCTALNCNNKKHYQAIEEFHEMIVKASVTAAELCIPRCTKKSCIRQIPGWSEHVEPYRKKSMFWHYMWKQNGCPRTGWIADIRKTTRAKFHYVLRHVKRKKETILANKLGESVLQSNSTDFWSSVRKIKGVKSVNPTNVDGVVGDANISNYLSDKYKKLYNSVSYNVNNMQDLVSNIDKLIVQKCNSKCYSNHSFNVKNVTEAVKLLKRNKSDGVSQWSDSIINGCHKLFVYLNLLYNSMLKHCFSPVNQ